MPKKKTGVARTCEGLRTDRGNSVRLEVERRQHGHPLECRRAELYCHAASKRQVAQEGEAEELTCSSRVAPRSVGLSSDGRKK